MKKNFWRKLSSWGNYPIADAQVHRFSSEEELRELLFQAGAVTPRGNGRSYGDAALGNFVIETKRLNKLISFDRETGIIEAEAGVLLSEILEVSVPSGWFLSVTPGTKFISLGGAVASDVHGKNHHAEGCFSESVLMFRLMDGDGQIHECSREENTQLFWATIGGMGLTGMILSVKFQLKYIETAWIRQESLKADNLEEIFQFFEESEDWTYNVAWIDCLQKGATLGRSILMRGEHALRSELPQKNKANPLQLSKKAEPAVPFYFPSFVLNNLTVKIFNYLYFNKQRRKIVKGLVDYETFFYPLDAIHNWNRIYGKKGFIQYQMVIPKADGLSGMKEILEAIAASGNGSFLAVLKLFGEKNPEAYNSFPERGYTLALDFKVNRKLPSLIQTLDAIVMKYGGRIYLTKDAMSNPALTDYLQNLEDSKFTSHQHLRITKGRNSLA